MIFLRPWHLFHVRFGLIAVIPWGGAFNLHLRSANYYDVRLLLINEVRN
jgi:hypothetical protein